MAERSVPGCLIAIAGPVGSGKSTIAQAVARRLDIPVHSIDDDKRQVGAAFADFGRWVAEGIPFPDEFRLLVYEHTLEQLRQAARQHPRVIVEETFHRSDLRNPFFEAGRKIFGALLLIEVAVTPEVAVAHLERRAKRDRGHLAGRAMYEAFVAVSDPYDSPDLVVENNGELQAAVDAVIEFLEA